MPAISQTVEVRLGERSYEIEIGAGNLDGAADRILDSHGTAHAVLVTDENVQPLYADPLAASLAESGATVDVLVVPPGEASKAVEVADALWRQMLDVGTGRGSVVVAVGGGVVGDLAGFAAATFARGLAFVQVPTTLLAQVDSSVGGKVGVNLPGAKNMVGAFWQPRGVAIDVKTLTTLPEREYLAGMAEVIKYGAALDAELFEYLESRVAELIARDEESLLHVIARCCRLKANVVEADEREESGRREVLNFGHTFGHAIESATGYEQLLHGEAVAIGMIRAAHLAERVGRGDADLTQRLAALVEAFDLPTTLPDVALEKILDAMLRDKKARQGRLRFVIANHLGRAETIEIADAAIVREILTT